MQNEFQACKQYLIIIIIIQQILQRCAIANTTMHVHSVSHGKSTDIISLIPYIHATQLHPLMPFTI